MRTNECYRKLGLSSGASLKDVEQAYSDLSKLWHRNLSGSDIRMKRMAEKKLKEITYAHDTLVSSIKSSPDAIPSFSRVSAKGVISRGDSNLLISYGKDDTLHGPQKLVVIGSSRKTAYVTALAVITLFCFYFFFPGEDFSKSPNRNAGQVIKSIPKPLSANSPKEAATPLYSNPVTQPLPPSAETAEPLNSSISRPLIDEDDRIALGTADSSSDPQDSQPAHPGTHPPEKTLDSYFQNPSSNLETMIDQVLTEKPQAKRRHRKRTSP